MRRRFWLVALVLTASLSLAGPTFSRTGRFGGSLDERVLAVATDPQGNLYFTGTTRSADFPVTPGALRTTYGPSAQMAFVVKLDPRGNFIYATYLGGAGATSTDSTEARGITADAEGNAYVVGFTSSTNFPTTVGAYQTKLANTNDNPNADTFLVKLNPTGTALVYGTLIGGRLDEDRGSAVAVDAEGNACAADQTTFTNPRGDVQADVHTASGDHLSFTDEAGKTIALGYNDARQRTTVTDRLGDIIGIAYHAPSGQPAAITNADGTQTQFIYVARAADGVTFYDVAQVTYPDGAVERFTYDGNGNVLTRTDRAGKVWSFTYNARGQVVTAQNPTGGTTTFTYDAAGNVASRADSDTSTTADEHDPFSRLTKVTHPDGGTAHTHSRGRDRGPAIWLRCRAAVDRGERHRATEPGDPDRAYRADAHLRRRPPDQHARPRLRPARTPDRRARPQLPMGRREPAPAD